MNMTLSEDIVPRIFILLLILLTVLNPFGIQSEADQEIIAIQSVKANPYEEAFKGFKGVCRANVTRIFLSESKEAEDLKRLRQVKPDLVLAIGMGALARVKDLKETPSVYVMVLNPNPLLSGDERITGVSMSVAPEKQLAIFLDALPATKTIGLLYDPGRTGQAVERARAAAQSMGISLLTRQVKKPNEVPTSIMEMKGKIDAFWMLPDLTVVTPETVEFLLLFALENNIPITTFSDKYVELGALLSVGVDPFDMGQQAGEMAEKILSGVPVSEIPRIEARQAVITVNLKIAMKLRITVSEKILRIAKTIE